MSFFVQYRSLTYSKCSDGKILGKGWGTDTASRRLLRAFFPLGHNDYKQRGNDVGDPQHPPFNSNTKRETE